MASSMGLGKTITDGMILCLDAANKNSYLGSGNNWIDLSGKNDSTVLVNGPVFNTNGGGSLNFDNTNDYAQISASAELLSIQVPMTICAWVRPSGSFDTYDVIFSQYLSTSSHRLIKLVRFDGGKFGYFSSKSDGGIQYVSSSASPPINQWSFLSVVVSGTLSNATASLYLNGIGEDKSIPSPLSSTPDTTVKIRIGANDANNGEHFRGDISHISVYNRALSANEVFQNYEATRERFNRPTIVIDDDARNFLNSANISSETQQRAVNDLVVDMKNVGLWGKMKAIYPFVGGTAASHKWNLKDPRDVDAAFRLTFSGGWTHSSTGATPNGTNAYADTYLISANSLNVDSAAVSVYLRTNDQGTYYMDLCDQDTARKIYLSSWFFVSGFGSNGVIAQLHTGGFSGGVANTDPRGFYLSSRTGNTVWNVYKNNAKISARTVSSSAADQPIKSILLAGNILFSAEYSTRQQAFATISDGLTDTDAANLYTIVQKYQTTLGRQV